MFHKIEIKLSGPICNCDEENLAWGIVRDKNGHSMLYIQCEECKTELLVPRKKFVASVQLDKPYPGKQPEPEVSDLKPVPNKK